MKSKLMLASMILLASLSASAQKIYTGTIEKSETSVDTYSSKQDEQNGKIFLNKLVTAVYDMPVSKFFKVNTDKFRTVETVFVSTYQQAKEDNIGFGNLPKNKGQIVIHYRSRPIAKDSGMFEDVKIIDLKTGAVCDLRGNKIKTIKI